MRPSLRVIVPASLRASLCACYTNAHPILELIDHLFAGPKEAPNWKTEAAIRKKFEPSSSELPNKPVIEN